MRSIAFYTCVLVSLFLLTVAAEASITTYSDRATYDAAASAIGAATTIDFSTKDDGSPITNPAYDTYIDPLVLRGVTFNGARSFYNDFIYYGPITANLPPNTFAFGLDLSSAYNTIGTFTVTLSSGESYSIPSPSGGPVYFGLTSDQPIQWAKFAFDNHYIIADNFSFSTRAPYNIADGDVDGLIAAINASNANAGPDTINLAPGGTYTLTYVAGPDSWHGDTGLPIIQGPSQAQPESLTINGNGAVIQRSSAPGTPQFRVFHALYANLVLDSVVIRGGYGQGSRCGGGGLYLNVSTTLIRNSTITENFGFEGGGICNNNASELTIENSTINHNTGSGGEIKNLAASLSLGNSTIYDDQPDSNRADSIVDQFSAPGSIVIKNSIVANRTGGVGINCYSFTPVSLGHNIFSDNTCGQNVAAGDLIVPDLTLGPLANNGGPTPTHALLSGNPAIDAIPVEECTTVLGASVTSDQRGVGRPMGAGCDIGAYELDGDENNPSLTLGGITDIYNAGRSLPNSDGGIPPVYDFAAGANQVLTFSSVTGSGFASAPGTTQTIAEGANNFGVGSTHIFGANGLSGIHYSGRTPLFMVGVFTDDSGTRLPTPPDLNYTNGVNDNLLSYSPLMNQVFFIGDGLTGTGTGTVQQFQVPAGATHLYLGFVDAYGYYGVPGAYFDNGGSFTANFSINADSDSTPPIITPTVTGILGNNGWYTSDVGVSWSVTDPDSAVSSSTGCDTQNVTTDTAGVTFTCSAVSAGGTGSQSVTLKRDATAPVITVAAPMAGSYLLNEAVSANYSCNDAGSGIDSCAGTAANGGLVNTSSVGAKTFVVNATDNAGNAAAATTINYSVGFGIEVLFDQTKANKSGSTIPVKIRLIDANGTNFSSESTVVHAVSVFQTSSQASTTLDDAGNANPDFDFRYDAALGGYIFNLKTTGYGTGSYLLNFVAGSGPTIYSVGFQVRK